MRRRASLAGLVAVAVSLAAVPQDEGERDAEAVLDELIERTSSIASYRVVYESTGEQKATLTAIHVWPDKAYVRFGSEEKAFTASLVDGVMFGESEEGRTYIDFGPGVEAIDRIQEAVRDVFPDALPDTDRTPGAKMSLFVVEHEHARESSGTFSLSWVTELHSPLPWLVDMRRYGDYELEGDTFHCRASAREDVWIDIESGFPTRLDLHDDEGTRTLERVELELDPEISDELFDASGFEEDQAPEEDVRRLTASLAGRQKDSVYAVLCRHFDSAPAAFDADDVRSVFDTVHEVLLEIYYAPWLEYMKGAVDEFGARLSEASAENPSEEIDQGIERFRGQLEERISAIVQRDLERLAEVEPRLAEDTPTEYLREMHGLEVEGAEAAYQRVLRDPVLEHLDEVIEANRVDSGHD